MLTKRTTENFYSKGRLYMKFRKTIAIIFCAAILFSSTACGKTANGSNSTASSSIESSSAATSNISAATSNAASSLVSSSGSSEISDKKLISKKTVVTVSDKKAANQVGTNNELKPLIDINMVTDKIGYAITNNQQICKTNDGWVYETDLLSLKSSHNNIGKPALFSFNATTIFTAIFTSSGIEIKKSTDSGKNWAETNIKMQTDSIDSGYGGNLAICFTDTTHGFLLSSSMPAGGIMGRVLYKTLDNGENWVSVNKSENSKKQLSQINGYTSGMTFFNSNIGIITCTYHGETNIPVYRTTDGGNSWSIVSVPIPKKFTSAKDRFYADAYSPSVFGTDRKNVKIELVFCCGNERYSYVYNSNDCGKSWKIGGISNKILVKYSFINSENGFGTDENGQLYTTHNGGLTWLHCIVDK